jgi:hypothetical protein
MAAATAIYTVYAGGQSGAMNKQVGEMQASGKQTDQMLCVIRQQLNQATIQAAATKSAAETARDALTLVQRPWLAGERRC